MIHKSLSELDVVFIATQKRCSGASIDVIGKQTMMVLTRLKRLQRHSMMGFWSEQCNSKKP